MTRATPLFLAAHSRTSLRAGASSLEGDGAPAPVPSVAASTRLADLFAPSLTLVLHLRSVREFGDAEVLRARATRLLDQARRRGADAGWPDADVDAAAFAAVAFLDETVQASSWSRKEEWLARPLQLELFGRYDAGEEFFARLEVLRADPGSKAAIVELYYLCLALGFRGRYQFGEEAQRAQLIEDLSAEQQRAGGESWSTLAPHARPGGAAADEGCWELRTWMLVVAAVLLTVLAYGGMSLYADRVAAETRAVIEAVQPPMPDAGAER